MSTQAIRHRRSSRLASLGEANHATSSPAGKCEVVGGGGEGGEHGFHGREPSCLSRSSTRRACQASRERVFPFCMSALLPFSVRALHFSQFRSAAIRAPLLSLCEAQDVRGTLLLAPRGDQRHDRGVRRGRGGGVRAYPRAARMRAYDRVIARASAMPFDRMKVRLKREIVTMGEPMSIRWTVGHICGARRLECADRRSGYAIDRYAQCL